MKDIKEIALDKWGFKLAFMKPFLVIIKDDVEKGDRIVFTHVDAGGNKFETNVVNIKSDKYGNAVNFEPEVGDELTQRLIYNEDIIMDFESPNPIATIDRTDYEIIKGSDFTNGIIRGGFMSADLLEIDTVYDLCYTDHMGYRHYIHDVLVTSCDPSSHQEGSFFPMFEIKGEIDDVECDYEFEEDDEDNACENCPQYDECWGDEDEDDDFEDFCIDLANDEDTCDDCKRTDCVYSPNYDLEDSIESVEDEFIKVAEGFHAMSGGLNEAIEDPRGDIGPDPTNPNYYKQASIELIDFMEETSSPEAFQGYCKNNVLKYVVRYKNKNGVEDLNKAMWYLQRLIESETK